MLTLDEKHLIHRTQLGDLEAFSPLVVKYHDRLYTHIHRRVSDVEVAKDLSQEVWLRAFRGIKSFRRESALSSWLYRIAENVCIDYFRRQKHQDLEPLYLISELRITKRSPCPSRDSERQELRQHLRIAIAELTPLRRVFCLYYHHELPIKAIAERLSKSEGTIKSHLRNALRQLQDLLTPYLNNSDTPLF